MHSKFFSKASAAVMAAAMAVNGAVMGVSSVIAAGSDKYEFEDADITGAVTVEDDASASGKKSLKMTESGTITLKLKVDKGGMYKLTFYAGGIGSAKQQNLTVNGVSQGSLAIPESKGYEPVTISSIKLKEGENTIVIEKSWGWTNFDYLTVEEATLPTIKATQTNTCDLKASAETRSLMKYLADVYGKNIISGQQEIYSGGPHGLETEFEYLKELTGHYPAIRGFDYGNFCCPLYGSDDGSTKRIIDWVKNKGGIATASFHINVPKDFASYKIGTKMDWSSTTYGASDTDFSPSKAATPGTKENEYYLQCLTTLAKEFNKLEEEGVPVIWRPLHEAEGGGGETGSWFWWGREGSAAYKKLWKYTYETLTKELNCHNLIWEWNSYNFDTSENWYPGDEYVDIIGYDKYNCVDWSTGSARYYHNDSPISSVFYGIMEKYGSTKMVSMAENDSFSTPDNLQSEQAGWLYFCTWYDGGSDTTNFLSNPTFNTKEDTIAMYTSDYCITLDELPKDLYKKNVAPIDPAQTTTRATTEPKATTTTSADEYKFSITKKSVKLPTGSKKDTVLNIEIEGAPKASIGGGFGYSAGPTPDDWKNIEWSGNADNDGKLSVSIDLSEVPDDVTSGEVQVWWSNVWDAKTEKGIDKPYEVTAAEVEKSEAVVTTVTTIPTPVVTTTTTKVEDTTAAATLLGDANLDGKVTLSDALAILQFVANEDKYPLDAQAQSNADVCDRGKGITAQDAVAVLCYDTKSIEKFPVTSAELPK